MTPLQRALTERKRTFAQHDETVSFVAESECVVSPSSRLTYRITQLGGPGLRGIGSQLMGA